MTWLQLKGIANSKFVSSMYFWMAFVPIAAHALKSVPRTIWIPIFNQPVNITLVLPFSWQVFYFSSISFALGHFIFRWRCPLPIRDYQDCKEYVTSGRFESTPTGTEKMKEAGFTPEQLYFFLAESPEVNGIARFFCSIAFITGYLGAAYIAIKNLLFVISTMI